MVSMSDVIFLMPGPLGWEKMVEDPGNAISDKEADRMRNVTAYRGLCHPARRWLRVVDWYLVPVEPGWAPTAQSVGTRSDYFHCRPPCRRTEEELLHATPPLLSPVSISQAPSVSKVRKCPSCGSLHKTRELEYPFNSAHPRQKNAEGFFNSVREKTDAQRRRCPGPLCS